MTLPPAANRAGRLVRRRDDPEQRAPAGGGRGRGLGGQLGCVRVRLGVARAEEGVGAGAFQ